MATLAEIRDQFPQYHDMSDADLAAALHAKFYSDIPFDQFAQKIELQPDKYQQAAIDDIAKSGEDAGLTRRLVHGATLGADSTILAAAQAPLEVIKRGVGLGEGYNYAKAREDQILNDSRRNTGALGTATELIGGGVAGGGLANSGWTTGRLLSSAPGLLGRTATTAADAAALGGAAGFNEGNGLSDRLSEAGSGTLIGAGLGAVAPVVGAVSGAVASPFISNIMARIDRKAMRAARSRAGSSRAVGARTKSRSSGGRRQRRAGRLLPGIPD